MKNWAASHAWLAASTVLALVIVSTMLIWVETSRAPTPSDAQIRPGTETTIEGEIVCLPHKNTSGPQTLECAFGVRLADGTYYGLRDSDESYGSVGSLPTGQKARLTGTLKEETSDTYQSVGTFTVMNADIIE